MPDTARLSMPPHRIFVVDDHPVMRDGVRAIVGSAPDLTLCGQAIDADEAMQALSNGTEVELLITDLSLPGMSGLELVKHVRALFPDLPILVLSMHAEAVYADRVIRAGAQGYLTKSASSTEILEAIREVLSGGVALSADIHTRLLGSHFDGNTASPMDQLSDRELEVFMHLGHGQTTVETAETMCISRKTVESHRAKIKAKLGIQTSNELVQRAAVWVATSGGVPTPS